MIIFETLRYKNFISAGDKEIEIDFLKSHTALVIGENGCGKCLRGNTEVEIKFDNPEAELTFRRMFNLDK